MPIDAIEADFRNRARDEVRSFTRLKLDGVDVGLNMLRDLEKHPDGIEKVVGDNFLRAKRDCCRNSKQERTCRSVEPSEEAIFFCFRNAQGSR